MIDISNFIVKAQTDADKFIHSSMRTYDAMNKQGRERPFNYNVAVHQARSWVYAATRMNAVAVASNPLRLYMRKRAGKRLVKGSRRVSRARCKYLAGDGAMRPSRSVIAKAAEWGGEFEEVVERTPILELLEQPNPWMAGYEFSMMRMLFLQLTGNFYMHPVVESARVREGNLNRIKELWVVPSQYVRIVPGQPDSGEWIKEYIYGVDSEAEQKFPPDEINHMKLPNPKNQFYGLGVVEAGWDVLKLHIAQRETDQAKYDNHARPDLAVITKSVNGTVQQLNEMQNEWARLFRGSLKAGAPVFLTGDTQVIPLNWMPTEQGDREITVEEIAVVTGVPVSMLKANDPNLASAKAGFAQWRENTILPYCRMDEEFLNGAIMPLHGIEDDAFLAYDNPVPEDRDAERNDIVGLVGKVWTINEGREKLGDAPLDEENADKLLVASGQVPLDKAGEPPPMASPINFSVHTGKDKSHGPHVPLPLASEIPAGKSDSLRNNRQLPAVGIVRQSEHIYSREKSGADDAREGEREKPIKEMIVRLQAVFDRQRKDIQERLVGRKSTYIPRDVRTILEQYGEQIADAVAPAMEAQVVAGGHAGLEGIELPPDVFNVTNPAVRQFIDKYTIRLAGEVNDYTGKLLSETLGEGLAAGESATQLSARVGALYDDFSGYRTEMIARTESARAFCAGNEEAWKQSNVVKGKAWDLAAGGCPVCQAISERFGEHGVALDQPFFPLGSSIPLADGKTFSVNYSPIMGPPGHPALPMRAQGCFEGGRRMTISPWDRLRAWATQSPVEALNPNPSDVIVCHCTGPAADARNICDGLKDLFPKNSVLVMLGGATLTTISEDEMRLAGWVRIAGGTMVTDAAHACVHLKER